MQTLDNSPAGRAAQAVHNAERAYRAHLLRCAYYENEAGSCAPCETGQRLYQATLSRAEEHRHTAEQHTRRTQFAADHADRFTDHEHIQIAAGLCLELTAHGMPWTTYCQQPPADGSLYCTEHQAQNTEQHGATAFGITI